MIPATDDELIRRALQAYDCGAVQEARYHAGTAARTWRVTTDRGSFLLRTRGSRTSTDELIAYDHALRRHLLAAGIPTAAPLATRNGQTCTRLGDKALELYAIVPGAPLTHAGTAEIAAAARALAAFHAASRDFALARALPPVAQYRTLGIDTAAARMESPALLALIYDRLAAEAGSGIFADGLAVAQRWLKRLRRDFGDDVYNALPHTVTHGDFTLANLLFINGRVSGIFDFDWARWAPRIRDVADGLFFISGERRTPLVAADIWSLTEAAELSPARVLCWLESYQDVAPLEPRELDCLPLALAARWLSVRVEGMAKVPETERLRFALGNVAGPLDWLAAHWGEVRGALAPHGPDSAAHR